IKAAERANRGIELTEKYDLPYFNVTQTIYSGISNLLDDQIPDSRRGAALVRLRKYVGLTPGYEPLTAQAKARSTEWSGPGQIGPSKIEVEADLARAPLFIDGIERLFIKYGIRGYEEPFELLKQQLADYNEWVGQKILPKTRSDFRLPTEEYAFLLEGYGVDIPPSELVAIAHHAFIECQQEMQVL